jgi:hypothetical protein
MIVTDTHVFFTRVSFSFLSDNPDFFFHAGDLLSVDISDPTTLFLADVPFDTNGTNKELPEQPHLIANR